MDSASHYPNLRIAAVLTIYTSDGTLIVTVERYGGKKESFQDSFFMI